MRDFGTATGETTPSGDNADWVTMRRFLPYLWPKNRPDLRLRIALATLLVIAAKAVTLAVFDQVMQRFLQALHPFMPHLTEEHFNLSFILQL